MQIRGQEGDKSLKNQYFRHFEFINFSENFKKTSHGSYCMKFVTLIDLSNDTKNIPTRHYVQGHTQGQKYFQIMTMGII